MRNTILIVEDDEMVRQGIVDALQLRNWKTDVAATCEEAEKKIKEDNCSIAAIAEKAKTENLDVVALLKTVYKVVEVAI